MGINLNYKEWNIGQIACIALVLISIASGLTLLILVFTRILPSTKKKNISIRIPKLMNVYLYITSCILIITIPLTSTIFCFIDYDYTNNNVLHYSIDNYIGAILFTISIIPLIITHISRFGLLRIQHGISNATMAFNLGEITWHEYLNKFEIILQEDYAITNPSVLRKYSIYISLLLITISCIILYLTNPFFYLWINAIWLGIVSIFTIVIVWIKSDNFNINDLSNKFKLDSYSILKEMHYITIILLIQFLIYLCICILIQLPKSFITNNVNECSGTVATHIILMIGLNIIWIIQLKYALRALFQVHKAVPLTQLLSSYDGYKSFLRFLVSELSIENLEFFQLSMRWRYRICCWLHGVSNGTKQPESHINLPFKIFSFQYIERLLPQQHGGGLVPNSREKQNNIANGLPPFFESRDSEMFFTTLPMSRKASVNSHFQSPYASNNNSRTTTPKFSGLNQRLTAISPGGITAPSSLHYALPPTIIEGNDEEERELTHTATTTYILQANPSYDEDNIVVNGPEYSQSLMLNGKNNDSLKNNKLEIGIPIPIKKNNIKLKNSNSTPTITSKSINNSKPTLSPLTMTAPTSIDAMDNYYRLRKIPREDEIIVNTPGTMIHHLGNAYSTVATCASPVPVSPVPLAANDSNGNDIVSPEVSKSDNTTTATATATQTQSNQSSVKSVTIVKINKFKPPSIATDNSTLELENRATDLCKDLTPVHSMKPNALDFKNSHEIKNKNSNEIETPNTPEPMAMYMPDTVKNEIELHNELNDVVMEYSENDDGMEYMDDYHQYKSSELNTIIHDKNKKKLARSVRFASTIQTDLKNNTNSNKGLANKMKDIQMIADDNSPDVTPKKHIIKPKINMNDLLGAHGGGNTSDRSVPGLPLEQQTTETYVSGYNKQFTLNRDESVASKAAEPSWFAAWFRKGNISGGQQERADALLQYSDLSWRRLKKVAREVNMSAVARGSIDSLFKKYGRSRLLETKGITLNEYDESMRDAWVSCWENMNDSLRRFAKSGHYETYLASIGQLTIKKVVIEKEVKEKEENGMDVNDGNESDNNNIITMGISDSFNGSSKKLTFRIRGKSKTDHSRAPAVIIT